MNQLAERSTTDLQALLLGPPSVEWDGRALAIARRQTRALLFYLAAQQRPVPREHLCYLFWPDTSESSARRNLTHLLTHLRRDLPDADILLTVDDQVGLDTRRVRADITIFEQLCASQERPQRHTALHQAVDLYRGPFLAGFSLPDSPEFEHWAARAREDYERRYLHTLETLIDEQMARGDFESACTYARRYLAVDELAEEVHRRLIEAYAALGDRKSALRQFEDCVMLLERELGVSPLPETRQVYRSILEGCSPAQQPFIQSLSPATWATLLGPDIALIGRDEVLNQLHAVSVRAWSGQAAVLLISGEAGAGKSRLVQSFATGLQPQPLLLIGSSYPGSQKIPFQPIVQALRCIIPTLRSYVQTHPVWLSEASLLLPELRTMYPDLPPPMPAEPEQAQTRLFDALCRIVIDLAAGQRPVLLCLDDLHWADSATLDWLGYFGRQLQGSRLLVVATYRSEEDAGVAGLRHGLARLGLLQEVRLSGMDVAAVRQLVRGFMGPLPTDEALAERLHRATGGNPFFLIEILQGLTESRQHLRDLADLDDLPLPDTIRQAVEARLDSLTPKARQVLEAGAVLGASFDFELLRSTSGRVEAEALDSLDELVTRHLFIEHTTGYQFKQEMVRAVVYQGLSAWRRKLLHRRAGEALEKQRHAHSSLRPRFSAASRGGAARCADEADAKLAAQLAYHYSTAGEQAKAASYLLQAGDRARGLYAYKEAIDYYRQALIFLRDHKDYAGAARTLMKLGLTYHIAFDFPQARRAYEEGFALWQKIGEEQPCLASPAPHPLRVDCPNPPKTFDFAVPGGLASIAVIEQLFNGLVEQSPEMDVMPGIALRWEVVEDGRVYVFHLRDEVRWSDGTPVTAGDFEFAWKRVLDPRTGAPDASLLYDIKGARAFHQGQESSHERVGVRALDRHTLVVELEEPASYFPNLLVSVGFPMPQHIVRKYGDTWTKRAMITNGPFRIESWQPERSLVLVRNPTYSGRFSGNVQRVDLSLIADWSTRLQRYEDDELDILSLCGGPPAELEQARQRHAGEYISIPELMTTYVGCNLRRPPFDDPRIRRAFALAIDRETLAEVILRGYQSPAMGGFVPPHMPGHSAEIGLPYDPEQARRLLAEAGYPAGQGCPPIDILTYHQSNPIHEYLSSQWRTNLNVEINWETICQEYRVFLERMDQSPPHMFLSSWHARCPDPAYFLDMRMALRLRQIGWCDAEYERLVKQARYVTDQEQRMRCYCQADKRLVAAAVIIPLTYGQHNLLLKPWVNTFPLSGLKGWFWKDVVMCMH